jgi:CO/xanthine dehydrogenase Mo-binding subunit
VVSSINKTNRHNITVILLKVALNTINQPFIFMPYFIVGELYLALVTSKKAHAKLLKVDSTEALKMKGVVDFISHKDVPGTNTWNNMPEEKFASNEVIDVIFYTKLSNQGQ